MGTKLPALEVDPLALPLGMQIGSWRVSGFRGRGAYGTLYRAEHVGLEAAGSVALKMAIYPGDERFKREAYLLSRIHSLCITQPVRAMACSRWESWRTG